MAKSTSESNSTLRKRLTWYDQLGLRIIRIYPLYYRFYARMMNFYFDAMPLARVQVNRAVSNGAQKKVLTEARRVVRIRFICINLLYFGLFSIYFYFLVIIGLRSSSPASGTIPIILALLVLISSYKIVSFHFGMNSPRLRLLLCVTRLIHLLTVWDTPKRQWRRIIYPNQQTRLVIVAREEDRFQIIAARKCRRLAWPLVRDLALWYETDDPKSNYERWADSGRVLHWISDRISDPRCRARGWELVAEICPFLSGDTRQPPALIVSAAAKYAIKKPRRERLRMAAEILKVPLVTGIIVAIVTAALHAR
jgi:hypothetical protein